MDKNNFNEAFFFYSNAQCSDVRRKALTSLAETMIDLLDFPTALNYYTELIELEKRTGVQIAKILESEISAAILTFKMGESFSDIAKLFKDVYQRCIRNDNKASIN